jgi:small subunit ribosomal protein S9
MADTRYTAAVGRRKTATASVRVTPASKTTITVNGKPVDEYFKTRERVNTTKDAFHLDGVEGNFDVSVKVSGGGISAQAEAVRHGIARALEKYKPELRKTLKGAGFLTRDPRSVERKKPGLLKARKRPSWSKR